MHCERFDLDTRKPPPKADSLGVGFGCHLTLPAALYTSDLSDFVELPQKFIIARRT